MLKKLAIPYLYPPQKSVFEVQLRGTRVQVRPKPIRSLRLAVHPPDGRVTLSVPHRLPEHKALEFLEEKYDWILKQQARILAMPVRQEPEIVHGIKLPFWGEEYILHLYLQHQGAPRVSCNSVGKTIDLYCRATTNQTQMKALLDGLYRSELKSRLPDLFNKWESMLGVRVNEYRLKRMKTRWGTCNPRAKRIWINVELAKKPLDCLEYIVVHELVHLLEPSHNKRFVGFMNTFLPNWRILKAKLNYNE